MPERGYFSGEKNSGFRFYREEALYIYDYGSSAENGGKQIAEELKRAVGDVKEMESSKK